MPSRPDHDATVLICTYNRAAFLGETLDTIARSRVSLVRWNVLVVDNNSNDGTRDVVMSRVADFPVPLEYLFDPTVDIAQPWDRTAA